MLYVFPLKHIAWTDAAGIGILKQERKAGIAVPLPKW